jgi:hypothetical protein
MRLFAALATGGLLALAVQAKPASAALLAPNGAAIEAVAPHSSATIEKVYWRHYPHHYYWRAHWHDWHHHWHHRGYGYGYRY